MSISPLPRLQFIDLFAGCGGLSLGLLQSGCKGLFAVELDKFAFETYRVNLIDGKGRRAVEWPFWVPKEAMTIRNFLNRLRSDKRLYRYLRGIDLVAGAPPCQGFSFAGKRQYDDPRNVLFRDYLDVVSLLRPKFLLLENVSGIAVTHDGSREPYSVKIHRGLNRLGYETVSDVHRASDFGVPQARPRFIVIGVDRARFPRLVTSGLEGGVISAIEQARLKNLARHGIDPAKGVSVRQAISDLEITGQALEDCPDAPRKVQLKYRAPKVMSSYQSIMRKNSPGVMDSMRLAEHSAPVRKKFKLLIAACSRKNRRGVTLKPSETKVLNSKKRNVVVLDPNKPSHTLTTLPDDLLHYSEPRILTVREYARLQSFPDWFVFRGKYTTGGDMRKKECPRYTQVGNAVAPLVAEALGHAIQGLARPKVKVNRARKAPAKN